ncbi:MAG: type II toxin-antitoxin system VapC family toxin [archaeon]|nr:type II toxin-antitoxin system VapC family toxin [archaeon]
MITVNVLIDSSGWIEFFSKGKKSGKIEKYIQNASKESNFVPSIVLFEVYKKIKKEFGEDKANQAVAYIVDSAKIIVLDERIAIYAAEMSLQTGLAMADAIIKATADLKNAELKTLDNHFKGMANVEII